MRDSGHVQGHEPEDDEGAGREWRRWTGGDDHGRCAKGVC